MPTLNAAELGYAFTLKPEEAIQYFESKGYVIGFNWHDVEADAHARAFTVAGVMKLDVLEDIKTALNESLKNGETYEEFKKNLLPTLEQKGWIGKGLVSDPETGELQGKQLTPRRLKTIFDTNNATNYNAGRYVQQMGDVANRPYWERVEVMDNRTRASCAAVHGFTARYDDPVWNFLYPPGGFGCRGRVRARSESDVTQYNLTVQSSDNRLVEVEQPYGNTTIQSTGLRLTSNKVYVPDPGFGFNPGKVAWQPNLEKYDYQPTRQYVSRSLAGPDFARGLNNVSSLAPQQQYPVGVLSPEQMKATGMQQQTVTVAAPQMQQFAEQDMTRADYIWVQSVIDEPDQVISTGTGVKFYRKNGNQWDVATVINNLLMDFTRVNSPEPGK
ncbi:phage head morphogenesis protein [Limnobaculum xujianqingii]|uniref:phage head morphogenesis protein n=1 Tax=Limnobaculum xujianqingii TaxID=2738837 RepID=UPI0011266B49|nr:phage minor head protein [Limnobaculum xujianqingii]